MTYFKKFFILLLFIGGLLYAKSEILNSGEEIVLRPIDGRSLNVVRYSGQNANFDIEMSNKGRIYYSAKNQTDDIYLVFHNDVQPGDRIKIHINSGRFRYNFSTVRALPKLVKKALYKNAVSKKYVKKRKRYKKKHRSRKKSKPKVINKQISPKIEPSGTSQNEINKSEEVSTIQSDINKEESIGTIQSDINNEEQNSDSQNLSVSNNTTNKKVLSDTFYGNFTKIFENLIKKFSLSPSKKTQIKEDEIKVVTKESEKEQNSKVEEIKPPKKEIKTQEDKRLMVHEATMIRGDFTKLPDDIEIFDDMEEQTSKQTIGTLTKAPVNTTPNESIENKEEAQVEESNPVVVAAILPPKQKEESEFKEIKDKLLSSIKKKNQSVIVKNPNNTTPIKEYQKYTPQKRVPIKKSAQISQVPVDYIDTGYKNGYKDIETSAPKEPNNNKLVDTSDKNKIVITKVLETSENKSAKKDIFEGRVLGKISDRVLGGGYNPNSGTSHFGMKVTKNSLPVSAWIEVFKNGTKQRVKTFYTSSTNRTKKVKLPAGVYMIRATYRTKDGKLQKTIKNIHLKEGDDITKHITFNEGQLKVVAKRGDRPVYVKVTVYKPGTKKIVNYDFSDRHTGIVGLSLPVGTYDIEVADHKNIKNFDSIKITVSNTQTLNIDF